MIYGIRLFTKQIKKNKTKIKHKKKGEGEISGKSLDPQRLSLNPPH